MRARWIAAAVVATLALAAARPRDAWAQHGAQGNSASGGAGGASASNADFDAGLEAFNARRYADALELFERAHQQSGSPNAMLYVARSLEHLGRIPEAVAAYDTTARDAAARASTEPRYAPTREAATAALSRLHDRVASVRLRLSAPPTDLVVRVGGRAVDRAAWDQAVYLEPGTVRVTAEAAGYDRFETTVAMAPGASTAVDVVLRPAGSGGRGARSGPPGAVDAGEGGHALRGPAVAALGVGVAGFAAALVFHTLADQQYNALDNCAQGGACPASVSDAFQTGRTYEAATNVGLAVGGAGVALGAVLLLIDLAGSPPSGASASSRPGTPGRTVEVGAGPGAVFVRGTF